MSERGGGTTSPSLMSSQGGGAYGPGPGSSTSGSGAGTGGISARMSKQQEAARMYAGPGPGQGTIAEGSGGGQYGVANPDEPVMVHRDAGRVTAPGAGAEIPPTYDSIPADER